MDRPQIADWIRQVGLEDAYLHKRSLESTIVQASAICEPHIRLPKMSFFEKLDYPLVD